MERWSGCVAVVTGASSGIGAALVEELTKRGLQVVGLARRLDKLQAIANTLKNLDFTGNFHPIKCDITSTEEVLEAFTWINKNLGGVDILVNSAGVLNEVLQIEDDITKFQQMMEVNVFGLSRCTREAIQSMKERGIDGHVVHINSFLGHIMSDCTSLNMYAATKHTITTLTEALRRELMTSGSSIKITSISPGVVRTELFATGSTKNLTMDVVDKLPALSTKDVVDAIIYALGTPPNVQVLELTILPIGQSA